MKNLVIKTAIKEKKICISMVTGTINGAGMRQFKKFKKEVKENESGSECLAIS